MSRRLCRSTSRLRPRWSTRKVEGQEPAFGAKIKVLQEDVEHHADEEEKEIFKEARKFGDDRLEQLGQQIQERKKETSIRGTAQPKARERKGVKIGLHQLMPING